MKNIIKTIIIILVVIIQYTLVTKPSRAQKVIYSNDFEADQENSSPSGWIEKRNYQWGNLTKKCMNNSEEATWKVVNFLGSKKVQISINGPSCVMSLSPDKLSIPDLSNYQYDVDITFVGSVNKDRNIVFRYKSGNEWYGIKLIHPTNILYEKINIQGYNHLGSTAYSKGFLPNATYHFTFKIIDNLVQLLINNELIYQIADQDPILGSGSIALQGSIGNLGSTTTYFDNIVVTNLSPITLLDVPFFSQQDPLWADTTYDSADTWAKEGSQGIKDWGCAMTSATMILNYHGITKNASGSATTPETLNQYLNDNDGYSQKGHLNWPSIVEYAIESITSGKLTATARAFDFLYQGYDENDILNDLYIEKPSIIRIVTNSNSPETTKDDDTHFVVAKGYDISENIYIADPLLMSDDNPKLEESYTGKYFSRVGRFLPYMDPTYLWIYVHDDKNYAWLEQHVRKLGVKDGEEYREIENGEFYIEKPSGGTDSENISPSWQFTLAKPASDIYTLNLKSPSLSVTPVEVFSYDVHSHHLKLNKDVLVGPNFTRILDINYDRENAQNTTLTLRSNFGTLKANVMYVANQGWLKGNLTKHFLNLIEVAEKLSLKNNKSSYVLLKNINQQIHTAYRTNRLTETGYVLIQSELSGLILLMNK